jgi:hypothetical protein
MVPKTLRRQKEPDCVPGYDISFALDPCHEAALVFCHRHKGGTMARMVFLDNLGWVFAGLIFEINDQGRT